MALFFKAVKIEKAAPFIRTQLCS